MKFCDLAREPRTVESQLGQDARGQYAKIEPHIHFGISQDESGCTVRAS